MKNVHEWLSKRFLFYADDDPLPIDLHDFMRADLAKMFCELECKTGVEIGVELGRFSEVLCASNPQAKIESIDPWVVYHEPRPNDPEKAYQLTQQRLKAYPNSTVIRLTSLRASNYYSDGELDFVYIDGDHSFGATVADIHAWSMKVHQGGIIAGHDYGPMTPHIHTKAAVNAYTKAHSIRPWFTLGRSVTKYGTPRDRVRSWFWVKP